MVNTNKILTVSYGTFSCTLEGFEESFDTMKAIAEYFRDLAADDRYFGAEPPTPDAEMLARIAEREIARRVEARMDEQNIHLRADPGTILPVAARGAAEVEAEAPAPAHEPAREAVETPEAAEPEAPEPETRAETIALQAPSAAPEPPAAETPAETAEAVEPAPAGDAADEIGGLAELLADQAAAAPDSAPEIAEPEVQPVDQADDATADLDTELDGDSDFDWPEEDAAAFFDAAPKTATAPAPTAETEVESPALESPDVESVAAKLSRIRAVVSHDAAEAEAAPEAAYSEDEHAEAFAETFLADAHEDIEAALAIDDQVEETRSELWDEDLVEDGDEDRDSAEASEGITALLDRFGQGDHSDETAAPDADMQSEALDADAALTEEAPVEAEDEAPRFDEADQTTADEMPEAEAEAESAPMRARVIKMKRADFEAALSTGDFEEIDEAQDEAAEEPATAENSSLSPEDEADLLRELAAVEAELNPAPAEPAEDAGPDATAEAFFDGDSSFGAYEEDADDDAPIDLSSFVSQDIQFEQDTSEQAGQSEEIAAAPDYSDLHDEDEPRVDEGGEAFADALSVAEDDAAAPDAELPSSAPSPFDQSADSEMERMFDMADDQMDEEAGKGRRNAIAHLRAAVAAAKAEGGKIRTHGPDTEAYRDDLDSVVRPRRPEAGKPHTRRPDASRPAPLKLVAEQRVDLDETADRAPIRPRRVSAPAIDLVDDVVSGGDFAEYAENVGANSLPELLEAAAAYLSFVEGREQFSRPQLMTQVRQVEQEDFSREDGLRSFGQLLREGKIEKIEGGRFKASESISYRPGERHAG